MYFANMNVKNESKTDSKDESDIFSPNSSKNASFNSKKLSFCSDSKNNKELDKDYQVINNYKNVKEDISQDIRNTEDDKKNLKLLKSKSMSSDTSPISPINNTIKSPNNNLSISENSPQNIGSNYNNGSVTD